MALSLQDRIASVQSGVLGAMSVGIIAILSEPLNYLLFQDLEDHVERFHLFYEQTLGSIFFAIISGFLFGVTYRYIRRSDPNPHLRTGAIAAFGLTRALAQIDVGLCLQGNLSLILLIAGESMLMIAVAAIGLDWAMEKRWIQRVSS